MNVVLTGDNTNITPYIVIMVIAIVVIAGVLNLSQKETKIKKETASDKRFLKLFSRL